MYRYFLFLNLIFTVPNWSTEFTTSLPEVNQFSFAIGKKQKKNNRGKTIAVMFLLTPVNITCLLPPVALSLMCRALIPKTLHLSATSCAANMAAYGEASSRSALTFIPPVTRTIVSLQIEYIINISSWHHQWQYKFLMIQLFRKTVVIKCHGRLILSSSSCL